MRFPIGVENHLDDLEDYGEDEYSYTDRLRRNYLFTAIVSFCLGIVVSYFAAGSLFGVGAGDMLTSHNPPKINETDSSEKLIAEGSVIGVAKKVKPSVVNIQTEQKAPGAKKNQSVDGVGSGIIVRKDGYIITNEHVIKNAKKIIVNLKGDKEKARVIGSDKATDIAVIKIDRKNLPVPNFAEESGIKVGELAVAIGSPFGFQRSVTAGVISALDRNVTVNDELVTPRTYADLIQTDAAINPGNSGGALSNKDGEIIGMNSLIYSNTGVSQGIGFAIPIAKARKIATEIIEKGDVSRPFLGVLGKGQSNKRTSGKNTLSDDGVYIKKVMKESPADTAGLLRGDVITKVDDDDIATIADLIGAINSKSVGERVTIVFIRDDNNKSAVVELREKD